MPRSSRRRCSSSSESSSDSDSNCKPKCRPRRKCCERKRSDKCCEKRRCERKCSCDECNDCRPTCNPCDVNVVSCTSSSTNSFDYAYSDLAITPSITTFPVTPVGATATDGSVSLTVDVAGLGIVDFSGTLVLSNSSCKPQYLLNFAVSVLSGSTVVASGVYNRNPSASSINVCLPVRTLSNFPVSGFDSLSITVNGIPPVYGSSLRNVIVIPPRSTVTIGYTLELNNNLVGLTGGLVYTVNSYATVSESDKCCPGVCRNDCCRFTDYDGSGVFQCYEKLVRTVSCSSTNTLPDPNICHDIATFTLSSTIGAGSTGATASVSFTPSSVTDTIPPPPLINPFTITETVSASYVPSLTGLGGVTGTVFVIDAVNLDVSSSGSGCGADTILNATAQVTIPIIST